MTLKCVTLWVRISTDMSGTPSATMTDDDAWIIAPVPVNITKYIVWTSYYLSLLVALLHDTLEHPRWNCYVILVTRCVLLYSYRNVDVPVTNNLVTCPARRWQTSRCMSGIPRVYLSIVGVAIPATTLYRTSAYYPVSTKASFIVTPVTE